MELKKKKNSLRSVNYMMCGNVVERVLMKFKLLRIPTRFIPPPQWFAGDTVLI